MDSGLKMKMKVSLVLTTYNCVDHLATTMQSISKQDYSDIEVVIKDGGSTDGTVDLIKAFADHRMRVGANEADERFPFEVVYSVCPDHGIYEAMNQGYGLAGGDIIVFFNDIFTRPDAVSLMVHAIEENHADGAHADLIYQGEDGRAVRYWHMGQGDITKGWMPGHPTLYLKREIYEKYGLYRTDFKIASDYEFMVRILKDHRTKLAYVPEVLVAMYYGGTSTGNFGGYFQSLKEGHEGLVSNGVRNAWLADLNRTCRLAMQFIRARKYSNHTESRTS